MATLTGTTISSAYKSLLKVADETNGVDTTLEVIEDGEATASCLYLSTKQLKIQSATDIDATFDVQNSSGHQLLTIDTASTPEEVVINEGGLSTIDFRVETDNGTNAIFVDSDTDIVHINSAEQAVTTQIHNTNDVALRVSATEVIVDDLTDLAVGMLITAVSDGSLSGTPEITAIDTNTKTLTLSAAQTFADGITLTMRAYGKYTIMSAIGVGLEFHTDSPIVGKELTAVGTPLKKSVASNASSTTINLVGTYGVSGGGFVTILGRNVNNNGTNTIQSVSADETTGSIVMQLDQTGVTAGTSIEFTGCTRIIKLTGVVTVTAHPNANRTINLDLDKFITLGVAS